MTPDDYLLRIVGRIIRHPTHGRSVATVREWLDARGAAMGRPLAYRKAQAARTALEVVVAFCDTEGMDLSPEGLLDVAESLVRCVLEVTGRGLLEPT